MALLTKSDPKHPCNLLDTPDVPAKISVAGEIKARDRDGVAVVGTRKASPYGITTAQKIARALARRGTTLISGAARGIDQAAHIAAMDAGGRTIAVLGQGIGYASSKEHRELLERIARNGAVISEFPDDAPPRPWCFPKRNKTIVALSSRVVVVEAPLKSGALITARLAKEAGKPVYAVPGPIGRPGSRGIYMLIRQGAQILEDPEEFAGVRMTWNENPALTNLSKEQRSMVEIISKRPAETSDLAARLGMDVSLASSYLLDLEIKGLIKRLPGGYYEGCL
ncbi:MAG: DNA-protecting protein DprA [Deltaproteobacteria bacterium]|nr:DNA-protecting protein DprA [Deltaproteobacteria bacterium]